MQHRLEVSTSGVNTDDLARGKSMAKFHPCPMVAALISKGKVVLGPHGEWSSAQADATLQAYFSAVGWGKWKREFFKKMLVGGFFGFQALFTKVTVRVPEWRQDLLHTTYSGIRLPKIKGDPDFFKGACNAHAFMRTDPTCGQPGPHPVVFDELAARLGKSNPNAKWSSEDTTKICSTAKDLFFHSSCSRDSGVSPPWWSASCPSPYQISHAWWSWRKCLCPSGTCAVGKECKPMAYRHGPAHKAACKGVFGLLPEMLGEITTKEMKALLTENEFPASFTAWKKFPVMRY